MRIRLTIEGMGEKLTWEGPTEALPEDSEFTIGVGENEVKTSITVDEEDE